MQFDIFKVEPARLIVKREKIWIILSWFLCLNVKVRVHFCVFHKQLPC